jgi:hypothetical protein
MERSPLRFRLVQELSFPVVEIITSIQRLLESKVVLFRITLIYSSRIILCTRHFAQLHWNLPPPRISGENTSLIFTMAVVRALETPEISPHYPPTYLFVPVLNGSVGYGESVAFEVPIVYNNVAFSFGRMLVLPRSQCSCSNVLVT